MFIYLFMLFNILGQLVDFMKSHGVQPLPFHHVIKIFAQLCRAVIHMHKQTPPVIHRDLKVFHLLLVHMGLWCSG